MALVLAGTGLFLYLGLRNALDRTVDEGLRSRADAIVALVKQADEGLGEAGPTGLTDPEASFAQVIDARGDILDSTPAIRSAPLLAPSQLGAARKETVVFERGPILGFDDRFRLLATPVEAQDKQLVVVVGASLEHRDEAVASLRRKLLIGGPLALVLASLAGYALAAAALRPVESMRRRAAEISAAKRGQQLPVPAARDEVSRLGVTLNEMLVRLEAAVAREQNFVADASHELRTPLALLKTELELGLSDAVTSEELRRSMSSAADETDRLVQLAEDLLLIARADQGRLPVRRVRTNLRELFAGLAARFARRAKSEGRRIETLAPPDVFVLIDRLRVEQALSNLVDNALRYGDGTIRLLARAADGRVELHVTDEGAGIPPTLLGREFERFTRADEARGPGGTGLGLAIVDAIARAHKGTVHAENPEGRGADVWLSLPGGI